MAKEFVVWEIESASGIRAGQISKVFDRFFRGDAAPSSEGTGLGLSVVKSIMDIHGGAVSVRSEPGAGTIVTFTFPSVSLPRVAA